MMFLYPWMLVLLVLVPIVGWWLYRANTATAVRYSSAASDWHVTPSFRQRFSWLPNAFALAALTLMILCLARPREGREQTVVEREGIAIEIVVDRSGSMQALDFQIDGQHVNRLTAIKQVATKFVLGDEDEKDNRGGDESQTTLGGRISDLVGLVTFARFADAITPPTLDHRYLSSQLNRTEIVQQRREDGTAIGDALSLAIDKLSSLHAGSPDKGSPDKGSPDKGTQNKGSPNSVSQGPPSQQSTNPADDAKGTPQEVKSKIIILLTDGENTVGEIEPIQAAELAKAMGIKIYTIGVGTNGRAPFPVGRSRSGKTMVEYIDVRIDEETLQRVSGATGGKYFRATDTQSLEEIYREIDQLEKTNVDSQRYVDYRELAVQSFRLRRWKIPPLLLIVTWLLTARLILTHTVFRGLT